MGPKTATRSCVHTLGVSEGGTSMLGNHDHPRLHTVHAKIGMSAELLPKVCGTAGHGGIRLVPVVVSPSVVTAS